MRLKLAGSQDRTGPHPRSIINRNNSAREACRKGGSEVEPMGRRTGQGGHALVSENSIVFLDQFMPEQMQEKPRRRGAPESKANGNYRHGRYSRVERGGAASQAEHALEASTASG